MHTRDLTMIIRSYDYHLPSQVATLSKLLYVFPQSSHLYGLSNLCACVCACSCVGEPLVKINTVSVMTVTVRNEYVGAQYRSGVVGQTVAVRQIAITDPPNAEKFTYFNSR